MSWAIEKPIPTFAVPALEVGIEYYQKLGFSVDWRWPEEQPTHAGLLRGACSIMLAECDPEVKGDVYFIVDDVEACHAGILEGRAWEMAESAGALADGCPPKLSLVPPPPPEDKPYGLRGFWVVDPWGNSLSFGQPVEGP